MAIRDLPRPIKYTERDGKTEVIGMVEKEVWVLRIIMNLEHFANYCKIYGLRIERSLSSGWAIM